MNATRYQILFGNVLLPAVGADHYHKFTVAAHVCVLVLRTFPGNTLRSTAVNIDFVDLWTAGLGLTVVILIVSMIFIPIFWPL